MCFLCSYVLSKNIFQISNDPEIILISDEDSDEELLQAVLRVEECRIEQRLESSRINLTRSFNSLYQKLLKLDIKSRRLQLSFLEYNLRKCLSYRGRRKLSFAINKLKREIDFVIYKSDYLVKNLELYKNALNRLASPNYSKI